MKNIVDSLPEFSRVFGVFLDHVGMIVLFSSENGMMIKVCDPTKIEKINRIWC